MEGGELKAFEVVRGEISVDDPLEPTPDGPARRVYTPLGPLLALGFQAMSPLTRAWAKTADGREWRGPEEPWLQHIPPGSTPELVGEGMRRLADAAEPAHRAGSLVWLDRVKPVLPGDEERPSAGDAT